MTELLDFTNRNENPKYDLLKTAPAIRHSLERKYITDTEGKILRRVIDKQIIQAADVKEFFIGKINAEVSRQIRRLIDKKMLVPEKEGTRKYHSF